MASEAVYEVRAIPAAHELEIRLKLTDLPAGPLRLEAPTWVPGAYGFMKYSRDLIDLRVVDSHTWAPIAWTRDGWSGFLLEGKHKAIEVSYRVYLWDPAWGELGGLLGHDQAVLLGTRYLYVTGHEVPCRVSYDFPKGWALHHPSGAVPAGDRTFLYPSYRVLLDTPVVAGQFELRTRKIEGVSFHHLFLDRAVGFETEVNGFIDSLMKVAAECKALFGSFPFTDYTWIFSFSPTAHWGLEHLSSTMIGLSENALIDKAARASAIRVSAHELFHAWNVCRLRPAPFEKMDHARGSFTSGMWVAEGFTRYYEFLLSVRAGELTPEQFFSNVVNYYRYLTAAPAYERVTAADSSRATFLNHNRYPGSINSTIDYYDKGMLIAFDLDATLRLAAKPSTLDREFAAFYEAYVGKGEGFTGEDVKAFFGARVEGIAELLEREVEQPGGLTVPALLAKLGFEVKEETVKYLGLILKDNAGPSIDNVLDDSPAGKSGIAPGDELLKVNGFPYSAKALLWLIPRGGVLKLEVKRGHRYFEFEIPTGERKQLSGLSWKGTAAQLAALREWLKRPELTFTEGQSVPLTSYENFHGTQTVI